MWNHLVQVQSDSEFRKKKSDIALLMSRISTFPLNLKLFIFSLSLVNNSAWFLKPPKFMPASFLPKLIYLIESLFLRMQSASQQVWHCTFLWINYIYFHLWTYLFYIIFQKCPVGPIIIIDSFSRPSLSPTFSMTLCIFVPCSIFLVTIFSLLLLPGIYTINKILSKYQRSIQRLGVWGWRSIFPWWSDV